MGLRTALEKRDQDAWLEATLRVNKEGYDTEQISEALEETLKDDPVGTARFMEDIHRAPQAMMVISRRTTLRIGRCSAITRRSPSRSPWRLSGKCTRASRTRTLGRTTWTRRIARWSVPMAAL